MNAVTFGIDPVTFGINAVTFGVNASLAAEMLSAVERLRDATRIVHSIVIQNAATAKLRPRIRHRTTTKSCENWTTFITSVFCS